MKRKDLQDKQILVSNEKEHIADHSIREAVFCGNMRDINLILENIAALALWLRDLQSGKYKRDRFLQRKDPMFGTRPQAL